MINDSISQLPLLPPVLIEIYAKLQFNKLSWLGEFPPLKAVKCDKEK
jgi:hypothetical protein